MAFNSIRNGGARHVQSEIDRRNPLGECSILDPENLYIYLSAAIRIICLYVLVGSVSVGGVRFARVRHPGATTHCLHGMARPVCGMATGLQAFRHCRTTASCIEHSSMNSLLTIFNHVYNVNVYLSICLEDAIDSNITS